MMSDEGSTASPGDVTSLSVASAGVGSVEPQTPMERDAESLQLLSRFLVGLIAMGGEGLMLRLRAYQQQIDSQPGLLEQVVDSDVETVLELFRFLSIGLLVRGEKALVHGIYRGFRTSYRSASWLLGKADSLTDNWLARPFRRPIESRLGRLEGRMGVYVDEGRLEEQRSRLLVAQSLMGITDDVMDYVANSPELTGYITDLIGGQGAGLAGLAADNAREMAASGDDTAERLVRRILRRKARQDLPSSPIAGQPQTMYSPRPEEPGAHGHDE
jgi:hypothetical protein